MINHFIQNLFSAKAAYLQLSLNSFNLDINSS